MTHSCVCVRPCVYTRDVGKYLGSSPQSDTLVPSPTSQVRVLIKNKLFSQFKKKGGIKSPIKSVVLSTKEIISHFKTYPLGWKRGVWMYLAKSLSQFWWWHAVQVQTRSAPQLFMLGPVAVRWSVLERYNTKGWPCDTSPNPSHKVSNSRVGGICLHHFIKPTHLSLQCQLMAAFKILTIRSLLASWSHILLAESFTGEQLTSPHDSWEMFGECVRDLIIYLPPSLPFELITVLKKMASPYYFTVWRGR